MLQRGFKLTGFKVTVNVLDTNSASAYALSDMRDITTIEKVSLIEKLGSFHDYWSPKIIGELNDSFVKVVKLKGEFVWHHHDAEDELFLVVKGSLLIKLKDRDVRVDEGEFIIIPHGVEHLPVSENEVHVLLLEPKSTLNTGNVLNERTVAELDRI
jgi:mannose-6-phosphate isomerase-like protein (cupin superfamily)